MTNPQDKMFINNKFNTIINPPSSLNIPQPSQPKAYLTASSISALYCPETECCQASPVSHFGRFFRYKKEPNPPFWGPVYHPTSLSRIMEESSWHIQFPAHSPQLHRQISQILYFEFHSKNKVNSIQRPIFGNKS